MSGLPIYVTRDLSSELERYLRNAHNLYIQCEEVKAGVATLTTDQINDRVITAALATKAARDALNSTAAGVAQYEWQLLNQTSWNAPGTLAAAVTALDDAWAALRNLYVANKTLMLNSRDLTLTGITSPMLTGGQQAVLVAALDAILATKGSA